MCQPTTDAKALEWHSNVMLGVEAEATVVFNEEPECGWFLVRLVKDGPLLPARIWLEQDIDDDTGELLDDEKLRCQVIYLDKDPEEWWPRLCTRPISQERYDYLMALGDWAAENETTNPMVQPFKKVSAKDIPMPKFT